MISRFKLYLFPFYLCSFLLLSHITSSKTEPVTLHWSPRPPYITEYNQSIKGLTATPALNAFNAAKIEYTLANTPTARFMNLIKEDKGLNCGIGWFSVEEREPFATFSKPLYQDQSQVVITSSANKKINKKISIEEIFNDPKFILVIKESYSYGKHLDKLIRENKTNTNTVNAENYKLLKMVHARRADYLIMTPEELESAIQLSGFKKEDFKVINIPNMGVGEYRYIMCNKSFPASLMEKLNKHII